MKAVTTLGRLHILKSCAREQMPLCRKSVLIAVISFNPMNLFVWQLLIMAVVINFFAKNAETSH